MLSGPVEWRLRLWFARPLLTADSIGDVIEVLATYGFATAWLSDVEPIQTPYSRATLRHLVDRLPYTTNQPCKTFAGLGRRMLLSVRTCLPIADNNENTVTVTAEREGRADPDRMVDAARQLLAAGALGVAGVDNQFAFDRQATRGSINERLPGVYWATVFAQAYVDAIGEQLLRSAPWHTVDKVEGGVLAYLFENPTDPPDDVAELARAAQRGLGREKFEQRGWTDIPQLCSE